MEKEKNQMQGEEHLTDGSMAETRSSNEALDQEKERGKDGSPAQLSNSKEEPPRIEEPLQPAGETPSDLPSRRVLLVTMVALFLGMFTSNLDSTILATATPRITDEFHSLSDIGWYASSGFLTFAAFQTTWGKIYKYFPLKASYLVSLFIFEVGSLICATAPTSTALIVGRAFAGVGGAGLCTGTFVIIGYSVEPKSQPAYMGVMGATYTLAFFTGPLLGGAFTERITWRWCFYINLPFGGLAAAIIILFFRTPSAARPAEASWKEILLQMDLVGCGLILTAVVCYLLALQWGGTTKPWSDSSVIGTLVGFGLISIAFIANEIYMGERASIQPRLVRRRRIWTALAVVFFNSGGFFVLIYYLPLYFQSIQNVGPIASGVRNLPIVIGGVMSVISGILVSKTQQFVPWMVLGTAISTVGAGLVYTFNLHTATRNWVGFQLIVGIGTGFVSQIPIMANTAAVEMSDMSSISAITLFFQIMGGSLLVSAGQAVFANTLVHQLASQAPGVSATTVIGTGATRLRSVFTAAQVPGILSAYMSGLKATYALAVALVGISVIFATMPKWERLKPKTDEAEKDQQESA